MKKLFILLLFLLPCLLMAQPTGFEYSTATDIDDITNINDLVNGQIIKTESHAYIIYFNSNTVGYKKSYETILQLVYNNSLSFSNPDIDNSYLRESISYQDYSTCWTSCYVGSGEIYKVWDINNWRIGWIVDEDSPVIYVLLLN